METRQYPRRFLRSGYGNTTKEFSTLRHPIDKEAAAGGFVASNVLAAEC